MDQQISPADAKRMAREYLQLLSTLGASDVDGARQKIGQLKQLAAGRPVDLDAAFDLIRAEVQKLDLSEEVVESVNRALDGIQTAIQIGQSADSAQSLLTRIRAQVGSPPDPDLANDRLANASTAPRAPVPPPTTMPRAPVAAPVATPRVARIQVHEIGDKGRITLGSEVPISVWLFDASDQRITDFRQGFEVEVTEGESQIEVTKLGPTWRVKGLREGTAKILITVPKTEIAQEVDLRVAQREPSTFFAAPKKERPKRIG